MSFYSRKLYQDVAQNWGGMAVLYLLLIVFISWMPTTYFAQKALNAYYSYNSNAIVVQVPVMTFKNGKMSTPEERAYIVNDMATNKPFMIVDTTGKHQSLDNEEASLLITKDKIFSRSKNSIRIDEIPTNLNMVVVPEKVNQVLKDYLAYAWVLLFPLLVVLGFLYRLIQSCFYAVAGLIFSAITDAHVSYGKCILLNMVSITPVLTLCTVLSGCSVYFYFQSLLYFLLGVFYLFFAIHANKK